MLTMGPLQSWIFLILLVVAVVLGTQLLADYSRRFRDNTDATTSETEPVEDPH